MATLTYDEIRPGRVVKHDGKLFEVVDSHIARTQQRKPQNQVKMKNILTGQTVQKAYHASETAEEVEMEKNNLEFIFQRNSEVWFNPEGTKNRFSVSLDRVRGVEFLKSGTIVTGVYAEETLVYTYPPIKVDLQVTEAPPAIKGNTAQGGNKKVTLETGAVIDTPLFIQQGDVVRVNTELKTYVERVTKA
ncbi:MAG: hypothetical protein QM526_00785 [Alphaproteobacteria bacterium]|nr:hypothetical protein [Alphaproteobacteria bacterium]